jgi:hypothetical protein
MDGFFWVIFILSALLHRWVGKVYIFQPRYNHPEIFRTHPFVTILLSFAPIFGFLTVIIGGFFYTDNGWWFLAAVIVILLM